VVSWRSEFHFVCRVSVKQATLAGMLVDAVRMHALSRADATSLLVNESLTGTRRAGHQRRRPSALPLSPSPAPTRLRFECSR
jgi:hypothetical protein